ncbi:MAG: lytic transglycosylase domain-containing protein, partial [Actinomycetota bacterium]
GSGRTLASLRRAVFELAYIFSELRRRAGRTLLMALGLAVGVGLVVTVTALATGLGPLGDAVREITLPLRHEDIIRQQAADKGIDSSLIAAVIYEESRFRDQTSHAGARGLMQITPATAHLIARESGGTQFTQADLATPQVNIAYGSYYLRYLLDRYEGNAELAAAAYNAGPTQVDQWVKDAGGVGGFEADEHIPYPETRAYAGNVLEREREYRKNYADELGL